MVWSKERGEEEKTALYCVLNPDIHQVADPALPTTSIVLSSKTLSHTGTAAPTKVTIQLRCSLEAIRLSTLPVCTVVAAVEGLGWVDLAAGTWTRLNYMRLLV